MIGEKSDCTHEFTNRRIREPYVGGVRGFPHRFLLVGQSTRLAQVALFVFELLSKGRKIFLYCLPDNGNVNSDIIMDQFISHS